MIQPLDPGAARSVETQQIAELNRRLAEEPCPPGLTAADLELSGAALIRGHASRGLPDDAVLTRLSFDGPPEFPYIHGHFATNHNGSTLVVDVHTAALRKLSHHLGVRQAWGS